MTFADLGLKDSSLKAIEILGFTNPSEIQAQAIPVLLRDDVDFIGQAQTGTGKTAAFSLPLFQKIDLSSPKLQALILAPTRELANQIQEEMMRLSQVEKVRVLAVYGGTPIGPQIKELKGGRSQVVVGTPGRVMDLIDRGALRLGDVSHVVLDEADEMLDMGFFDDVKAILAEVPEKKIWMFSATMPGPIKDLINEHFCNPVTVKVTKQVLTTDAVKQQFVVVRDADKVEALCRYLDATDDMYAIIFTKTKIGAKELTDELNARGYLADALHGDMEQAARDMTMRKFKDRKISLLVCTDVAARGIDVSDLTHVVNFSLPQDNESYVHRIGRTGRGGAEGVALSLIAPNEMFRVSQIERITRAKIERIEIPSVPELRKRVLEKAMNRFAAQMNELNTTDNESYQTFVARFETMEKSDLLKGVYAFMFEQGLRRYAKAQEISVQTRERGPRQGGESRMPEKNMQRFFMNVGRMDGMGPGEIVKMLSRGLGIRGGEVGRIDIREKVAFVELPLNYTDKMLGLKGQQIGHRRLAIEVATGPAPAARSSGPRRPFPSRR